MTHKDKERISFVREGLEDLAQQIREQSRNGDETQKVFLRLLARTLSCYVLILDRVERRTEVVPEHYYHALPENGQFRGEVYRYDESGRFEIVVWQSDELHTTEGQALDAAVEWCEDKGLEAERG